MQREIYRAWWPLFGSVGGLLVGLMLWPFMVVHEMVPIVFAMLAGFGHFAGWAASGCYWWATRWKRREN